MNSRKPLTPSEHIALTVHLRAAADLLDKMTPITCCDNCAHYIAQDGKRHCTKVMQQIPDNYHGLDCKMWSEDIPF